MLAKSNSQCYLFLLLTVMLKKINPNMSFFIDSIKFQDGVYEISKGNKKYRVLKRSSVKCIGNAGESECRLYRPENNPQGTYYFETAINIGSKNYRTSLPLPKKYIRNNNQNWFIKYIWISKKYSPLKINIFELFSVNKYYLPVKVRKVFVHEIKKDLTKLNDFLNGPIIRLSEEDWNGPNTLKELISNTRTEVLNSGQLNSLSNEWITKHNTFLTFRSGDKSISDLLIGKYKLDFHPYGYRIKNLTRIPLFYSVQGTSMTEWKDYDYFIQLAQISTEISKNKSLLVPSRILQKNSTEAGNVKVEHLIPVRQGSIIDQHIKSLNKAIAFNYSKSKGFRMFSIDLNHVMLNKNVLKDKFYTLDGNSNNSELTQFLSQECLGKKCLVSKNLDKAIKFDYYAEVTIITADAGGQEKFEVISLSETYNVSKGPNLIPLSKKCQEYLTFMEKEKGKLKQAKESSSSSTSQDPSYFKNAEESSDSMNVGKIDKKTLYIIIGVSIGGFVLIVLVAGIVIYKINRPGRTGIQNIYLE